MQEEDSFFWVEEYTDGNSFDFSGQDGAAFPKKRKGRMHKLEYVGWGSKPLIEFLKSIGVDSSKQISQFDVASIVNKYASDHNLHHPTKKKRIQCDDALLKVFGRKTISRIKIHELLEAHFAQNLVESDDDFFHSSEEENCGVWELQNERKTPQLQAKKKAFDSPRKSCFAALVPDNIKLIYLKRSLVLDLIKNPETFEAKVLGCFVRIKSDPNDFSQKNSHLLVQVTGIKKVAGTDDESAEVTLHISNFLKDVPLSMLSDDNFNEEECKDLQKRVMDGILKRPTIVELEDKARVLHEDITKHWLVGELSLLQKLIDRANEKGWRKELFEYLERRQLLQTPAEQSRLLQEVPKVIADELDVETQAMRQDTPDGTKQESPSPKSTLSSVPELNGDRRVLEVSADESRMPMDTDCLLSSDGDASRTQDTFWAPDTVTDFEAHVQEDFFSEQTRGKQTVKGRKKKGSQGMKKLQVIDLSDDDATEGPASDIQGFNCNMGSVIWYYADPQRITQGPFSIIQLKRWDDANFFPQDFKVWKKGQTQKEAALLIDVLKHLFPN